nr:MAG: hypothetical protein [Cressdnaviricota sp.]
MSFYQLTKKHTLIAENQVIIETNRDYYFREMFQKRLKIIDEKLEDLKMKNELDLIYHRAWLRQRDEDLYGLAPKNEDPDENTSGGRSLNDFQEQMKEISKHITQQSHTILYSINHLPEEYFMG